MGLLKRNRQSLQTMGVRGPGEFQDAVVFADLLDGSLDSRGANLIAAAGRGGVRVALLDAVDDAVATDWVDAIRSALGRQRRS